MGGNFQVTPLQRISTPKTEVSLPTIDEQNSFELTPYDIVSLEEHKKEEYEVDPDLEDLLVQKDGVERDRSG